MSYFSANPHPAGGADPRPDSIECYLALARQRPDLFTPNPDVSLVMDPARLRAFAAETGKPVGLVFDNRPYYMVLADLCESGERQYVYGRVVYPRPDTSGTVAIPVHTGRFGLLRIFRHAHRAECLEFPRGYTEPNLTPEENIRKELAIFLNLCYCVLLQGGEAHERNAKIAVRQILYLSAHGGI